MIIEIIMLLFSFLFILLGDKQLRKSKHLKVNGKRVEAKVVRHIISKNGYNTDRDGVTSYPVVEFLTEEGEKITQKLNFSTNPVIPIGRKINILYDPKEPQNIVLDNVLMQLFLPVLFIVLGVMGIVVFTLELLEIIDIIK